MSKSTDKLLDALESQEAQDAQERMANEVAAEKVDTASLARILYQRGVKIEDIFGHYYAFEQAGDARTMDVEDVYLAGYAYSERKFVEGEEF